MEWNDDQKIETRQWRCGFCRRDVASDRGWVASDWQGQYQAHVAWLAICPRCRLPSLITSSGDVVPPPEFGEPVEHVPTDVEALYDEARRAVTQGSPNAAALACRKILMHVGVEKGAPEGGTFVSYVSFLSDNGYVPPDAREWIDEIREHGNDANHEIDLIDRDEAENMVEFTAMMLRVVYEYPQRGRLARAAREARRP